MGKEKKKKKAQPKQQQPRPGKESSMKPEPVTEREHLSQRLENKVALVTGGDSGIGSAVAVAFAQEGCDVAVSYLSEDGDAKETQRLVEAHGRKCLLFKGDITRGEKARTLVERVMKSFGKLDILVNNAAEQFPTDDFTAISEKQLMRTFEVNFFAAFRLTQAAVKVMKKGSCIINTASITAYRGHAKLIDYSSTKGALVSFTRSLSAALVDKGIRVNAVAPGRIWTPLIVSTFKPKEVAVFGTDSPMGRAGQPAEVAPAYVFLASKDASYISGQVIHPNGGQIVNG